MRITVTSFRPSKDRDRGVACRAWYLAHLLGCSAAMPLLLAMWAQAEELAGAGVELVGQLVIRLE